MNLSDFIVFQRSQGLQIRLGFIANRKYKSTFSSQASRYSLKTFMSCEVFFFVFSFSSFSVNSLTSSSGAGGRKPARHAFIQNNKLDARNQFNKSKRRESWRHWTIRHSQRWHTPLGSRMRWRMESTSGLVPSKTLSSI